MQIPTPFDNARDVVRPEWIDYNGHMNVGYYQVVFDFEARLLDFDAKRIHFYQEMFHATEGYLAASRQSTSRLAIRRVLDSAGMSPHFSP